MCEFCHKHGEGKKWYLQMENYSKDLFSRDNRKEFVRGFIGGFFERYKNSLQKLDKLKKAPRFVQRIVRSIVVPKYKKIHYGQVVPIEDLEKIISMMKVVVRIPCVCRKLTIGKEVRYCFGVGAAIHAQISDFTRNFDVVKKEEAVKTLRELDAKGLMHSVWTFKTPFIGGICNCDQDCMAYKSRVQYKLPLFFKAEYVATIDPDKCIGCSECRGVCQFGAVFYSAANEKCTISLENCYGCGVCRAVCPQGAITLRERKEIPEIAGQW